MTAAASAPRCALIADDLTGALDAGAGFVRAGLRATLPFSGRPEHAGGADVVLINTESREQDAATAAAAARRAAMALRDAGISRVYKKMDSVLRGHPGPELAAVLDVFGGRALVAPAFPAQGRTTRGGIQYAHGQPVTTFGGDLRRALGEAAARSDVLDAASDADLAQIARRAAGDAQYRVWCGTAGLAAHVPAAWGLVPAPGNEAAPPVVAQTPGVALPAANCICVVAASLHPATLAQVAALADAGWTVIRLVPLASDDHAAAARLQAQIEAVLRLDHGRVALSYTYGATLAQIAAVEKAMWTDVARINAVLAIVARVITQAMGRDAAPGLIVTGGETALHLGRALAARAIHVAGEALPGLPIGALELPQGPIAVATKSGGFGGPDALLHAAAALLPPR